MFKITNCREGPQYIWPRHVIFLNQQRLRDQAKKRLYVWKGYTMPGAITQEMIIFVPGRSQLIIFRVFRANQLCKTFDLELRSSGIWCFFARALGTISVTFTTILDDHFYFHPAVKTLALFFPFPFFFRSLYFLSSTFANYWTSVWDSHGESNMTSKFGGKNPERRAKRWLKWRSKQEEQRTR